MAIALHVGVVSSDGAAHWLEKALAEYAGPRTAARASCHLWHFLVKFGCDMGTSHALAGTRQNENRERTRVA